MPRMGSVGRTMDTLQYKLDAELGSKILRNVEVQDIEMENLTDTYSTMISKTKESPFIFVICVNSEKFQLLHNYLPIFPVL